MRKIIYFTFGAFYFMSIPIVSNNLMILLEGEVTNYQINKFNKTDAIVVLSGMLEVNQINDSTYIEWKDPDRFFEGINLMQNGNSQMLVFTGGKISSKSLNITEGDVLKEKAIKFGIPRSKIFVTLKAKNTENEAIETKKLLGLKKNIILVTSAYHMFRAKKMFLNQGFAIIEYKVDYKASRNDSNHMSKIIPSFYNLYLTTIGMREILARIYYF